MLTEEKLFEHAVTLTAAFIANGDIRCGDKISEDTQAMEQVQDMITTLYSVVTKASNRL